MIVASFDGEHVLAACGGSLWLEVCRTRQHHLLTLSAGPAIAVTERRAWTVRDGRLVSEPLRGGDQVVGPELGTTPHLTAARSTIVASGSRGAWLARDTGEVVELAVGATFARAISDHRYLLIVDDRAMVVETSGTPRAVELPLTARVIDAAPALDRATFVLLLDRGDRQELVVMRASGVVLLRMPVRHVAKLVASANSHVVALATSDGRVIVYDLHLRTVISVDKIGDCAIALVPDGSRLVGMADSMFERVLAG